MKQLAQMDLDRILTMPCLLVVSDQPGTPSGAFRDHETRRTEREVEGILEPSFGDTQRVLYGKAEESESTILTHVCAYAHEFMSSPGESMGFVAAQSLLS